MPHKAIKLIIILFSQFSKHDYIMHVAEYRHRQLSFFFKARITLLCKLKLQIEVCDFFFKKRGGLNSLLYISSLKENNLVSFVSITQCSPSDIVKKLSLFDVN